MYFTTYPSGIPNKGGPPLLGDVYRPLVEAVCGLKLLGAGLRLEFERLIDINQYFSLGNSLVHFSTFHPAQRA